MVLDLELFAFFCTSVSYSVTLGGALPLLCFAEILHDK